MKDTTRSKWYQRLAVCLFLTWVTTISWSQNAASAFTVAVPISLSGPDAMIGQENKRGIELALAHFKQSYPNSRISLSFYDDEGKPERAQTIANTIVQSDALAALGPNYSALALATGPIFAKAGLACLPAGATSDAITRSDTTFRMLFSNGEQGVHLARYVAKVLGIQRVAVFASKDSYGQTLKAGFAEASIQEGLNADFIEFDGLDALPALVDPVLNGKYDAYVLLMLEQGAENVIKLIRKRGDQTRILGGDTLGEVTFSKRFEFEPEEQAKPGFFTDGVMSVVPVIFDSVNGETMKFVSEFQTNFDYQPGWNSVISYETARLVFGVIEHLSRDARWEKLSTLEKRTLLTKTLEAGTYPIDLKRGLLAPMIFNASRARSTPLRVGVFENRQLISAPIQIVSLPNEKIVYQKVVYSGIYLNRIYDLNIASRTFKADFYIWMRYSKDDKFGTSNPGDIIFPELQEGIFSADDPVEEIEQPGGEVYKLWQVRGKFSNEFDLYTFPFDKHRLILSFFNRKASMQELVYVIDQYGFSDDQHSLSAQEAFDSLKQWTGFHTTANRENLVTRSTLGNPSVGSADKRELSGFQMTVDIKRGLLAALAKNLLPFVTLSALLYASLFFRQSIIGERIALSIGVALAAAFLLVGLDTQLGQVSTILIDYLYLLLLVMSLFNVFAVIVTESRSTQSEQESIKLERKFRLIFVACYAIALAWVAWELWRQSM